MASVKQMEDYFTDMAKGKIGPSEMYVINQKGRGIGNTRRGKAIYHISQSGGGVPRPSFISPIAQSIAQAQSEVKSKKSMKRKRSSKKHHSAKKRRKVQTSKKKGKVTKQRRKSKSSTSSKTNRRKRNLQKDIFS